MRVPHLLLALLLMVLVGAAASAQTLDTFLGQPEDDQSVVSPPGTTAGPAAPPEPPGTTGTLDGTRPSAEMESLLARLRKFWEDLFGTGPGTVSLPEIPGITAPSVTTLPPPIGTVPETGSTGSTGGEATGGGIGEPTDEASFAARAQTVIDALRAKGTRPGVGVGDAEAQSRLGGFPDWFGSLQDLLCGSNGWTDTEEEGRALLRDYATRWAAANLPQPTFHTFPEFFKYLGCAENNDSAIASYGFKKGQKDIPRSGYLGGGKDAGNWCAFASNKTYVDPIKAAGFRVSGEYTWANKTSYIPQYGRGHPKFSVESGDYISNGTHAMTVLQVRGNRVLCVSGNAGGGSIAYAGTVRIHEIDASSIQIVKKHSQMSLSVIQAHADDPAWLKAHGLSKR